MLMKPRRWLGYSIHLNDELPGFARALDVFEQSDVPLDDTFGSSSDVSGRNQATVLMIGPRVEQARLIEILDLLAQARVQVHFLQASGETDRRKTIYIGSYNLDHEKVAPFTRELESTLRTQDLDPDALAALVQEASTVAVITAR